MFLILAGLAFGFGQMQGAARGSNRLDPATGALQRVVNPVGLAFSGAALSVGDTLRGVGDTGRLRRENARLRAELEALSLYREQTDRLGGEVARLRALQDLPPTPGRSPLVTEVAGFFPLEHRITLPKGRRHGVRPGMAVTTGRALLAVVQTVDDVSCQAWLLTSVRQKLGAVDLSRRPPSAGLLQGSGGRTLAFTLFSPTAPVAVNDVVATSGYGGLIPRGLTVGKVVQVEDSAELGTRRAVVEPMMEMGEVREVVVLR